MKSERRHLVHLPEHHRYRNREAPTRLSIWRRGATRLKDRSQFNAIRDHYLVNDGPGEMAGDGQCSHSPVWVVRWSAGDLTASIKAVSSNASRIHRNW